jgi:NCAIR mutase (PurE)-related protein
LILKELRTLLEEVRKGKLSVERALEALNSARGFVDLGEAKPETQRSARTGLPEVIFCQGKSPEQIAEIFLQLSKTESLVLAARATLEHFQAVQQSLPQAIFHERARLISLGEPRQRRGGPVLILTAGTSDLPIAEEAAVTAELLGNDVWRAFDVGAAGVHRLLAQRDKMREARVIVVVAGMDGVLPTVVAGLVDKPVIAVPTSIGYGASFQGLSALLTMLNSCVPGVAVVNIDNGLGAGVLANRINQMNLS